MERLIVGKSGTVMIPPELVQKLGLGPGDEMRIIETALGWTVYSDEVDDTTLEWWDSLSEEERRQATEEGRKYEALSEEEKEAIWNQFDESLEDEDEEDQEDEAEYVTASGSAGRRAA